MVFWDLCLHSEICKPRSWTVPSAICGSLHRNLLKASLPQCLQLRKSHGLDDFPSRKKMIKANFWIIVGRRRISEDLLSTITLLTWFLWFLWFLEWLLTHCSPRNPTCWLCSNTSKMNGDGRAKPNPPNPSDGFPNRLLFPNHPKLDHFSIETNGFG
jgi:hypothetical protein